VKENRREDNERKSGWAGGWRKREGEGEGEGEKKREKEKGREIERWRDFPSSTHSLTGPLTYRGVEFDKYGGIHYNGCAFENGGYREKDADDERRRYREVCIEKIVLPQ
jgi:hypothetical protein